MNKFTDYLSALVPNTNTMALLRTSSLRLQSTEILVVNLKCPFYTFHIHLMYTRNEQAHKKKCAVLYYFKIRKQELIKVSHLCFVIKVEKAFVMTANLTSS